jgi:hypothetical protein
MLAKLLHLLIFIRVLKLFTYRNKVRATNCYETLSYFLGPMKILYYCLCAAVDMLSWFRGPPKPPEFLKFCRCFGIEVLREKIQLMLERLPQRHASNYLNRSKVRATSQNSC